MVGNIELYLICANICYVFMHIAQDGNDVYLLHYSRSRCLFVAWWWWTSITSSSQTSLPSDVTTFVPPFNHPIFEQHTPLLSLDEATQSDLLIGYFMRHEGGIEESSALKRVFLRIFSTLQSTAASKLWAHKIQIQITLAHTYKATVTECSDTFGPVLFSKQIMTSKHALLSFQMYSFQRDHRLDVFERLKTLCAQWGNN